MGKIGRRGGGHGCVTGLCFLFFVKLRSCLILLPYPMGVGEFRGCAEDLCGKGEGKLEYAERVGASLP